MSSKTLWKNKLHLEYRCKNCRERLLDIDLHEVTILDHNGIEAISIEDIERIFRT